MFPYTVKCTESGSDIQNNDLLYTIHQQCQNTFDLFEKLENPPKNHFKCLFRYLYKFHNSYFVNFVTFIIWGFSN